MRFEAIIFDFDGVLLDSEYAGNKQIADYLTGVGHPTTPEESMTNFMGLAGADFLAAIERWIGRMLPDDFHVARQAEDDRAMREGLDAIARGKSAGRLGRLCHRLLWRPPLRAGSCRHAEGAGRAGDCWQFR